jgi:DNA-binding CsgD family transcriptional regulator
MGVRIKKVVSQDNTLTDKERRILQNLADGMTVLEAGRCIGYSKSGGEKALQNAREKFSVQTTYSLLAKAIRLGLVK